MSITEAESGLTSQQYTDIQIATGDLAAAVVLQRFGPVWTTHDTEPTRSGSCFDVIIVSTYLARVFVGSASDISVERLADESGGDQAWASVTCNLNDVDTGVPPSLVSDGLTVRLFYYSTGGVIKYSEIADISAGAFGAAQTVGAVSNVIFLAAVDVDKVHYIVKNSNNNRVLHVYEDTGAWGTTASDIYWPFKIYAFDAVTLEAGKDLLAIATNLAPLIGTRVIGAEVTTEVNKVQAIVHFWVSNGRWSDHAEIDVIDRVETDLSRNHLRMALNNSLLFTSYLRRGGTEAYPYSKAAVTRSADGVNWEFPEIIEALTPPFAILARTDYLYAVGVDRVLRSPCCAWAGQTPVEYNVTDYILGLDSSAAEIRNSQVQVSNPEGVLAGTLAVSNDRLQAVYELGYVIGGTGLKMQVSLEDVVERAAQENLPKKGLALTTRDFLGRVNRVRSDYAAEWPGIQAGRDTYNDPSGTGHGGLRHTAPYEGSWKTPGDEEIHLISKNKEGLAVSTFVTDALNGSAETAFQVNTAGNSEYAGIAFRTFDKDNLLYFIYDQDTDKLKLVKGVGTDDDDDDERDNTTLATSYSVMSWSVDTWYWLKVVVRYSLVYAFYSTDGITWVAVTWDDGAGGSTNPIELTSPAPNDETYSILSGRFGLIGYGYSANDTWPPYDPPPWDPPIDPDMGHFVVVMTTSQLGVCTDFFTAASPGWLDVGTGLSGAFYNFVLASDKQAWLVTYGSGHTDTTGLFHCPDIFGVAPVWTLIFSHDAANADAGVAGYILKSLAITSNDTVYIAMTRQPYPNEAMGYWTVTGTTVSAYVPVGRPPNCAVLEAQFGLGASADGTEALCGGHGNYTAAGHVVSLPSETYVKFNPAINGTRLVTAVSANYCMGASAPCSNIFKHTVDINVGVYANGFIARPLIEAGDSLLYTHCTTDNLMKDGVLLEDPVNVFGVGRDGGGYCCCDDDVDEIIWLCQDDHTLAASCRIAYSPDGAVSWLVKDGDWATEVGNWAGGGTGTTPIVKHYRYSI